MIRSQNNKLFALIDNLNGIHLIVAFLVLTSSFAFAYWMLSNSNFPENGLHMPENNSNEVTFGDAIYFSFVTEATLGYGDIRPTGWSKALASLQVILGMVLAGVVIAKITAMQGKDLRVVGRKASGDWIEYMLLPDNKPLISFVTIILHGAVLRYDGESYQESGDPVGFWRGEMIGMAGSCLRFDYSNRESHRQGDAFSEGIASLQFTSDKHRHIWIRFVGTAHDFGTKNTLTWQGIRASTEESEIIHGADDIDRGKLIEIYVKKVLKGR